MMLLSQAAFLDLARRFASAEEFARWQIDNKASLRAEREARRAVRAGASVGQVESGLRVAVGLDIAPSAAATPVSAEGLQHPRVKLAVARKAVPFCGVSRNAQEVLGALLDFCNKDTLRCCPGLDFIVKRLGRGGADPRRHVRRGIGELVTAGLLKVAAHAGMRHANAYFPQWDRLAGVVAAFESGLGVRVQSDSPDSFVPQTQKKIPTSATPRTVQRARAAALVEPDRRQRQLPLVAVVPRSPERLAAPEREASVPPGVPREQAGVRVMQALTAHLRDKPPRFAERVRADIGSDLLEAAITAEVRTKGGGIAVILDGLGPGPPGVMPAVSEALKRRLGERG